MTEAKKIPGDRLVLALISAFRTFVFDLSRKGVIDHDKFSAKLPETLTISITDPLTKINKSH